MTVTLVSGFLNHHQLSLCSAFNSQCDKFYYIATEKIPRERLALGYKDSSDLYDFVLKPYESKEAEKEALRVISESDIVIFGTCPDSYIEHRMRENKLSFLYSERFFKKGLWRRFIPRTRKKLNSRILKYKDKNLYVLCASAFLPYDLSKLGFPTEKCFSWGYFPEADSHKARPQRHNKTVKLLWAGRLISWKHPEDAVKGALYLEKNGVDFTLDILGEGEKKAELEAMVQNLGLSSKVRFCGAMPPEKVRGKMREADIFLMTSDYNEGWGAVVNEAMSEGCALLASSAVGSVPYLIEDEVNGLVYRYADKSDFLQKLLKLAKDKSLAETLGENAFLTIKDEYNAQVGAQRLLEFSQNTNLSRERGPMSKAPVIKNRWY
ncbi:MAG: glycosyltransferase [Eubacteriales bacterium]|nr:glycosyltransferase [Eubacteriales bacterium]